MVSGCGRRHFQDGLIYRMCWATGVLPVSRNTHLDLDNHDVNSGTDCFSPSPWGRLITVMHLVVVSLCAYSTAPPPSYVFTYYGSLWIQGFSSSILSLLLALLHHPPTLVACLSKTCKISSTNIHARPLPLSLLSFLMVYPFITIFTSTFWVVFVKWSDAWLLIKFSYPYIQLAAVEVIFFNLCTIVAEGQSQLNYHFSAILSIQLKHVCYSRHLDDYICLRKFIRVINDFFGVHLLNVFISFTLRMISYVIVFVKLIKLGNYVGVFSYSLHTFYSFIRIWMICRSCQNIQNKTTETNSTLRRLRLMCVENMPKEQSITLDSYEELMWATRVEVTACGLFPVNMGQVFTVLGLILTYGLVAGYT